MEKLDIKPKSKQPSNQTPTPKLQLKLKPALGEKESGMGLKKILTCPLSRNGVKAAGGKTMVVRQGTDVSETPQPFETPVEGKKVRHRVPQLKLSTLSAVEIQDYNDEFYSNMEQFSPSWRRNAEKTRTLHKP